MRLGGAGGGGASGPGRRGRRGRPPGAAGAGAARGAGRGAVERGTAAGGGRASGPGGRPDGALHRPLRPDARRRGRGAPRPGRGRRPAGPGADGGAGPDFVEQGAAPAVPEAAPARAGGRPPVRPSEPRPGRYDAVRGGPRRDPAGRLSHGIVDISAHLLPDPSDSWRSHLAFGAVPGPDGTQTGDIDRLSVQTVAAQRFPVPPDGPGLCVSLASWMNGLPRRHQDESFTMAAAFLAGGASSVLGSLWLVRLHATALVDLLFHHELRTGHAPADALRQAQLWMAGPVREPPASMSADVRRLAAELLNALTASGHDPADPAFWAGLVVVGR
ncbi:CHAT domain-containing protein [Streptomyces sp. WAC01490]|uniref:CHAT domain-containing protein n=1 Tax=Streptomyces sp. WAC01490 TaxID=3373093 RepID=UPI003F3CC751